MAEKLNVQIVNIVKASDMWETQEVILVVNTPTGNTSEDITRNTKYTKWRGLLDSVRSFQRKYQ